VRAGLGGKIREVLLLVNVGKKRAVNGAWGAIVKKRARGKGSIRKIQRPNHQKVFVGGVSLLLREGGACVAIWGRNGGGSASDPENKNPLICGGASFSTKVFLDGKRHFRQERGRKKIKCGDKGLSAPISQWLGWKEFAPRECVGAMRWVQKML